MLAIGQLGDAQADLIKKSRHMAFQKLKIHYFHFLFENPI